MFTRSEIRAIDAAVLNTITDVGKWGDVIRLLIDTSGAAKGILALRHSRSADFEIPGQVLESPLIIGFSKDEIESFVTKYVALDPWTEIEKKCPPIRPYAFSKYLPIAELKKTPFWEWLKPQRVSDSIVVSVGAFETYWVGLNLFFDGQDDGLRQKIIALVDDVLPTLKRAWDVSEIHRMASQQTGVTLREIAFLPISAFFCRANGETNMVTDQLRELQSVEPDLLRGVEPNVQFEMREHQDQYLQLLQRVADDGVTKSMRLEYAGADLNLSISRVTENEDILGRRTAQFLCVLTHPAFDEQRRVSALLASDKLSERELQLFQYLKNPEATIGGFSDQIGKSRHVADFHWRNLKRKLGINSIRELRQLTNEH